MSVTIICRHHEAIQMVPSTPLTANLQGRTRCLVEDTAGISDSRFDGKYFAISSVIDLESIKNFVSAQVLARHIPVI